MEKKPNDPEDIFDLLQPIGEGTFGTIYKAMDKRNGKVVAIKIIPAEDDIPPINQQLLTTLNSDKCPYIVNYTEIFSKNSEYYWIILDYCSTGSVLDIMKATKKTLNEEQIQIIMRESLMGLKYLHSKSIIHRDIKAGNIMISHHLLTQNNETKLLINGYIRQNCSLFNIFMPTQLIPFFVSFYRENEGVIKLGMDISVAYME